MLHRQGAPRRVSISVIPLVVLCCCLWVLAVRGHPLATSTACTPYSEYRYYTSSRSLLLLVGISCSWASPCYFDGVESVKLIIIGYFLWCFAADGYKLSMGIPWYFYSMEPLESVQDISCCSLLQRGTGSLWTPHVLTASIP